MVLGHHLSPGESVAALIRDKDWSKTSLGIRKSWPAALESAVRFIIASGFPMAVRWGADFVLIYNDGYSQILGEKHPWALGRPFKEVWPEVQPRLGPLHNAILSGATGAEFHEDLLLRIRRYGDLWEDARFTISYSPVPDETALTGVGGVLITAVETTARVQMEEALRESEERFARIVQQTSVGIIECALDGRFLLANKRFSEITGYSQEELLALKMDDLVHPQDKEDVITRLATIANDGNPYTSERRIVRPDGTIVWVSNSVATTRDATGNPLHIICIVQDVSDRKSSEIALAEREADLRLILDSATDAIYCVDTEGATTLCNSAFLRMLGFESAGDAMGKKLHNIIHHKHPDGSPYPKEECPIYNTAKGFGPAHIDYECFYRLDGSAIPVEYWASPIYRGGELQGAVCTFIDITERKRAQEQQSLLVSELNHRVKNLFTVASSLITLSARSATSAHELATSLRGRMEAFAAAHDLVLPQGTSCGRESHILLSALIAKILVPYGDTSVSPKERISIAGQDVEIGVHAMECLALVFHELATNAAKYGAFSMQNGFVTVTWEVVGGELRLTWREMGGPTIRTTPSTGGFGTVLSNRSVQGQLGGKLMHNWKPEGLVVSLAIPVMQLRN